MGLININSGQDDLPTLKLLRNYILWFLVGLEGG